ncbi:MAG: hypothetical protein AAFY46_16910, partial [Planctomycetota bacterium]
RAARTGPKENDMETLNALKTLAKPHDETKHPARQGFASPLVVGLVSYAAAMAMVLTVCTVTFG